MNAYILLDPRFISFRPSLRRTYFDVAENDGLGTRIGRFLRHSVNRVSVALRRSATRCALHSLDDALLRDIGIDRRQIEAIVETMLMETAPMSVKSTASVHQLVAKSRPAEEAAPRLRSAA